MKRPPVLLLALRSPEATATLDLAGWDILVRQARQANLLASLHALLEETGSLGDVPPQARDHMEWSRAVTHKHAQVVAWEVTQIRKAMTTTSEPVILLKGAAYLMAGLPSAKGRLFSDVDIMVPKAQLEATEAALMMHGWTGMKLDAYDQRYYRTWMHELPPMQHVKRMTVIDVHHAILPETSPLHPSPEKLRAASVAVEGAENLRVLAPTDMVLHSAVHMIHDGEMNNALRDLYDFHRLLGHFGTSPDFWDTLVERAAILELSRPLFYALRYASMLLHTPIPPSVISAMEAARPALPLLAMMDWAFSRALLPAHSSCAGPTRNLACQLLYIRANWLRMPPLLLARHLFHKAFLSPSMPGQ